MPSPASHDQRSGNKYVSVGEMLFREYPWIQPLTIRPYGARLSSICMASPPSQKIRFSNSQGSCIQIDAMKPCICKERASKGSVEDIPGDD